MILQRELLMRILSKIQTKRSTLQGQVSNHVVHVSTIFQRIHVQGIYKLHVTYSIEINLMLKIDREDFYAMVDDGRTF